MSTIRPVPSVPLATPEDLGALLRQARIERGMTQQDLADMLDVSRRYIVEIEAGKPSLYSQRLFRIVRILGVRLRGEIRE